MQPRTRSTLKSCGVMAAAIASVSAVAPAVSADQGSLEIVAIAPAFCRVSAIPRTPAATFQTVGFAAVGRACNTVNDAQITARVSNLDGATLQLGGADIAVSATGAATFSPQQLAALSNLHVVDARPGDARAQVAVELTITPQ
jgi:hypothetical protein